MAEGIFSRARFIKLGAALGVGASVLAACGGGAQQATDAGATGGVEGATQSSGEATSEPTSGGESQ